MSSKLRVSFITWILIVSLVITMCPQMTFATGENVPDDNMSENPSINAEDLSEKDAIESEKTETTTTYDMGDGLKRTVFHGGDIRYENDKGEWVDYDPTLVPVASHEKTKNKEDLTGYSYKTREGDKINYIPGEISKSTPMILEYDKYEIKFNPTSKTINDTAEGIEDLKLEKEKQPALYEDKEENLTTKAIYTSENKDVTFEYESGDNGIKENIVLEKKPETNVFNFDISIKDMYAKQNSLDSGITFYDSKSDEIIASIDAPYMNDASGNALNDEDINYELKEVNREKGQYRLVLTIDEDYLNDEKRVYPVTVDPTTTWKGTTATHRTWDAYVCNGSKYKGINFYDSGVVAMAVGKGSKGVFRTYMKFADLKTKVKNQSIKNVTLSIYETGDSKSGATVQAHRVTESFAVSKTTWNNRAGYAASTIQGSSKSTGTKGKKHNISLLQFVKGLASNSYTNYGVMLRATDESVVKCAQFFSSRHSTAATRPSLAVEYYSKPSTATSVTVPAKITNGTGKVNFAGISSTGLKNVQYRIAQCNSAGTVTNANHLAYAASRTITNGANLPSLSDGYYRIYVRGINNADVAGAEKGSACFYIDKNKPTLGGASITNNTETNPASKKIQPTLSWTNFNDAFRNRVEYSINGNAYKSTGSNAVSGSYKITDTSQLIDGKNTVTVRGIDNMGHISNVVTLTCYYDTYGPEHNNPTLIYSSSSKEIDGWTNDNDPIIKVDGIRDRYSGVDANDIYYTIVPSGDSATGKTYSPAASVNLSAGDSKTTTFKLQDKDKAISSGAYDIYVKILDKAGNESTPKFVTYKKHTEATSVDISAKVSGYDSNTKEGSFGGVTNIYVKFDLDSKRVNFEEGKLELYDSNNKLVEELDSNVFNDKKIRYNTVTAGNGTYTLKYTGKDEFGYTATKEMPFVIFNKIGFPKEFDLTKEYGQTTSTSIKWNWGLITPKDFHHLEYSVGNGPWIVLPNSEKDKKSGEENIALNITKEGIYKINFKTVGANEDPAYQFSETKELTYVYDKTAPFVKITKYDDGIVSGTVADDNFKSWVIGVREKGSENTFEKLAKGNSQITDNSLADISKSLKEYAKGQYEIRLYAEDLAGNSGFDSYDLTITNTNQVSVESLFKIKGFDKDINIIARQNSGLSLIEREGAVMPQGNKKWYLNNKSTAFTDKFTDNFNDLSRYPGEKINNIMAEIGSDEDTNYSSDVYVSEGYTGSVSEAAINSSDSILSFKLGSEENAQYQVSIDGNSFVNIEKDTQYYISSLIPEMKFAHSLVFKTESMDQNVSVKIKHMDQDKFKVSYIDQFTPKNLKIGRVINYKPTMNWEVDEDIQIPEDVTYEVHKSPLENFTPNESTLVAQNLSQLYYTDINTNNEETFYKVRAVHTQNVNGKINKDYSKEETVLNENVLDEGELNKPLGDIEHRGYTDFSAPNAEMSIEHADGNLLYKKTDIAASSTVFSPILERTYNSLSNIETEFGKGFDHSFNLALFSVPNPENSEWEPYPVFKDADGKFYQFDDKVKNGKSYMLSEASVMNLTKEAIKFDLDFNKNVSETAIGTDDMANDDHQGSLLDNIVSEVYAGAKFMTTSSGKKTIFKSSSSEPVKKLDEFTVKTAYTLKYNDDITHYFNEQGEIVLSKDKANNFMIYERDEATGLITAVVNNAKEKLSFTYNKENDKITEVKLSDGSSMKYDYANGFLKEQTHVGSDGSTISYKYGYTGLLSGILSPGKDAKINKVYDANNNAYELQYSDSSVINAKYPNNEELSFERMGKSTNITKNLGSKEISKHKNSFNADGYVVSSVDPNGLKTEKKYDRNLLISTTTYRQPITLDGKNVIVSDDLEKIVTKTVYDNKTGRELSETETGSTAPTETKYKYNEDGDVTEELTIEGDLETKIVYTYEDLESDGEDGLNDEFRKVTIITYVNDKEVSKRVEFQDYYDNEIDDEEDDDEDVHEESSTRYDDYGNEITESDTSGTNKDAIEKEAVSSYDELNRVLVTTEYAISNNNKPLVSVNTNKYDGFGRDTGNIMKYADGTTESVTKHYDANGNVVSETNKKGTTISYDYDAMNKVILTKTIGNGKNAVLSTTESYKDISVKTFNGTKTIEMALEKKSVNPNGEKTFVYLDSMGNIVKTIENDVVTDTSYTIDGNEICTLRYSLSGEQNDISVEASAYDDKGLEIANIKNPEMNSGGFKISDNSIVTQKKYDDAGRELEIIDENGNKVRKEYEDVTKSKLTKVILPDGSETTYDYDGATLRTFDAKGHISEEISNDAGNLVSVGDHGKVVGDSSKVVTSYQYDSKGNMTKEVYENGDNKVYEYDANDKILKTSAYKVNSTTPESESHYKYNSDGNLSERKDLKNNQVIRYVKYNYDEYYRMTEYAESNTEMSGMPADKKYTYEYDNMDRVAQINYPTSAGEKLKGVKFVYEPNGSKLSQVKAIVDISLIGNTEKLLRQYTYDKFNRATEIKDYYDFSSIGSSKYTQKSYSFDDFDRVTKITHADSSNTENIKESYEYAYDNKGQVISEKVTNKYSSKPDEVINEEKTYEYDDLDRLISYITNDKKSATEDEDGISTSVAYTYDKVGNRVTQDDGSLTNYQYDELDRLMKTTDEDGSELSSYAYDRNGNKTREENGSKLEENSYDALNRLSKTTIRDKEILEGDEETPDQTVLKFRSTTENQYNGESQRIKKTVTKGEGAQKAVVDTNYFYQDGVVSYTTDQSGKKTSHNIIESEDNIIATERYSGDSNKFYSYNKDSHGSVTTIIGDQGQFVSGYQYSDFGETTKYGDNNFYNEVCYTSGLYDDSTELYYLNSRYYNPSEGRFITQDTYRGNKTDPSSQHLYAYCENNPVNYIDPTGFKKKKKSYSTKFWNNRKDKWRFPFEKAYKHHKITSKFGSARSNGRKHAAVDLKASVGTYVYAMTESTLVSSEYIADFFGGTSAIAYKSKDKNKSLVRYCEIKVSKDKKGKLKKTLKKGGKVGKVIKNTVNSGAMLHLEVYSGKAKGSLTNRSHKTSYLHIKNKTYERRKDLINPTNVKKLKPTT